MDISPKTKLILGSVAAGALVGLAARGIARRLRARKDRRGLRTVATFEVQGEAAVVDAEWEALPGRALFKRLCSELAALGFAPSDSGDIEASHECFVHVDEEPLYVAMQRGGQGWVVVAGRRRARRQPISTPADTAGVRRFLSALDGALRELSGPHGPTWHRREHHARGKHARGTSTPFGR